MGVHSSEKAEFAAQLVQNAVWQEGIGRPRILHADNGSPMKGATLRATLQRLGIAPSYSRLRVGKVVATLCIEPYGALDRLPPHAA